MNEHQKRALWITALRAIIEAIETGVTGVPTSIDMWTMYVTPDKLLHIADNSGTAAKKITVRGTHAQVTIPVGERLDLPIEWTYMATHPKDIVDLTELTHVYELHNEHCVIEGRTPPPATVADNFADES